MPVACEWPGGCANDSHHQVPDGVPVFNLTKIGSDEIDGVYCRVHAQLRASQMGKEARGRRGTSAFRPQPAAPDACPRCLEFTNAPLTDLTKYGRKGRACRWCVREISGRFPD